MLIRKTTSGDCEAVLSIYEDAKASLRNQGIDQWQDGYPNAESLENDIQNGISYVTEENGVTLGTAAIAFGIEPTYNQIFEGNWSDETDYGFIHRVAVSSAAKGKGVAALFFSELEKQAKEKHIYSLRVDTHKDNLPMQAALSKNGYVYRGNIYLQNGAHRLAFEKNI